MTFQERAQNRIERAATSVEIARQNSCPADEPRMSIPIRGRTSKREPVDCKAVEQVSLSDWAVQADGGRRFLESRCASLER